MNKIILKQWTGTKDINGENIYTGDIIRYPAGNDWENKNFISYIVWRDRFGYTLGAQFHGVLCGGYVETNLKNANKMQKIGNVCENPELLEVQK